MRPSQPKVAEIRHLILDRDGVLNVEAPDHGYILRPGDFKWLPGSLEALVSLSGLGMRISIASNQSAVGRGLITAQQMNQVMAAMLDQARMAGARIGGVFVCMHAPEDHCDCRKPAPGLILSAIEASGIPTRETLMLGDDLRDIEAARAAGIAAALVRTGKGQVALERLRERGEVLPVFADLAQFAHDFAKDRMNHEQL